MSDSRTMLSQWARGEYGEHTPGGSTGPLPLPSEVNSGGTNPMTAQDYKEIAADTKIAFEKGLWFRQYRTSKGVCDRCHMTLPVSGTCGEC